MPTLTPAQKKGYYLKGDFLTANSTLDFGIYQGMRIGDIMEIDPGYLVFVWYKKGVRISPELLRICKEDMDDLADYREDNK